MEKQNIIIDRDRTRSSLNYNLEDFLQAAEKEKCMFPAVEILSDEYVSMRQIYQSIFSQIILTLTGLARLDKRFADRGYLPGEKMGFYQKYDQLGLDYIYIRGNARVERLEPEERRIIKEYLVSLSENLESTELTKALINMVYESYSKVMAVEPEKPLQMFEPVRTIHGDYQIQGSAIMFVLRSIPDFDENKNIRDMQKEITRENNFFSVAPQLERVLTHALDMPVKIVAEVL